MQVTGQALHVLLLLALHYYYNYFLPILVGPACCLHARCLAAMHSMPQADRTAFAAGANAAAVTDKRRVVQRA